MKARTFIWICYSAIFFSVSIQAVQTNDEPTKLTTTFEIEKIKTKGIKGFPRLHSWVPVEDDSSVVLVRDDDEARGKDFFRSFILDDNGAAGKSKLLLTDKSGVVRDSDALWLSNQVPSTDYGLLFTAIDTTATNDNIRICVAKFDESGKKLTNFKKLFEISAKEDTYYNAVWLAAAMRDGTIGLIVCGNMWERSDAYYGRRTTEVYFLEVSSDGSPASPEIVKVKLPNSGDYRHFRPYTPAWNGESWLAPGVMTIINRVEGENRDTEEDGGYQLMLIKATPTPPDGKLMLKARKIAKDRTKIHWPTFIDPQFLPANLTNAVEPVSGDAMNLIYIKASPAGPHGSGINAKTFTYFKQPIGADGTKDGPKKRIKTAPWKRQFEGESNLVWEDTYCHFSNALPGTGGRVYIAHSRSEYFYNTTTESGMRALHLDLYWFDPATGKVDVVAESVYKGKSIAVNQPPIINDFGDSIQVLNLLVDETKQKQSRNFYFSKFSK